MVIIIFQMRGRPQKEGETFGSPSLLAERGQGA
jgi:hypothetical protein